MPLEDAIFDRAKTHAGLASLLGAGDACRCYPVLAAPKTALPYLVHEIEDDEEQAHAMGSDVAVRRAHVRMWCYASGPDAARDLATQVLAAFRRYCGTHAGVTLHDCYVRGNRDGYDEETMACFRLIEIEIVYQE